MNATTQDVPTNPTQQAHSAILNLLNATDNRLSTLEECVAPVMRVQVGKETEVAEDPDPQSTPNCACLREYVSRLAKIHDRIDGITSRIEV